MSKNRYSEKTERHALFGIFPVYTIETTIKDNKTGEVVGRGVVHDYQGEKAARDKAYKDARERSLERK